jgi:hypothetical protein
MPRVFQNIAIHVSFLKREVGALLELPNFVVTSERVRIKSKIRLVGDERFLLPGGEINAVSHVSCLKKEVGDVLELPNFVVTSQSVKNQIKNRLGGRRAPSFARR